MCRRVLCWRSVSACLLISMVFSAVFARFGWLNRFGTADRSVFLFERLFQLFEGVSCRLAEQLRATAGADECWFVVLCFCLRPFLFVLLCLARSAPQLPWFVGLADSFFDFELPIRQLSGRRCITGCCFYPLLAPLRRDFYLTDCCVLFRLLARI